MITKDSTVVYTLTLTVTRAVETDYPDEIPLEQVADWMMSTQATRELEKEILKTLRRLDGDCDIDCLSADLKEND